MTTLRIGPEVLGATCTLKTMVTEPPSGKSAWTSGDPVPEATSHTPPAAPAHVHDNPTSPLGTGSDTSTSSSVAGPRLLVTMVYENVSPGSAVATLAALLTDREPVKSIPTVALAVLFEGSGSIVSGPTEAVAVLTIVLAAAVVAVVVTLKVAVPPAARSTIVAMSPVPLAGHDEPGVAVHVHDVLARPAGMVSSTLTAAAGSGPVLVTTTV